MAEEMIVRNMLEIVSSKRDKLVKTVVIELYKRCPCAKDVIQNELNTSVLALIRQYPKTFHLDEILLTVNLTTDLPEYLMEEVSKHHSKSDAWIVVDGLVYNITDFVQTHWGWTSAGKTSTIIAIMSALGSDCTRDFLEVHRELPMWPSIQERLRGFLIGRLVPAASPAVFPAAAPTLFTRHSDDSKTTGEAQTVRSAHSGPPLSRPAGQSPLRGGGVGDDGGHDEHQSTDKADISAAVRAAAAAASGGFSGLSTGAAESALAPSAPTGTLTAAEAAGLGRRVAFRRWEDLAAHAC